MNWYCRRLLVFAIPLLSLFAPNVSFAANETSCNVNNPDLGALPWFFDSIKNKRVAFVVGNGRYDSIVNLRNPENDADAVANELKKLGFIVFLAKNVTANEFNNCLMAAADSLKGADIGLFYYSGHGLQYNDENYALGTESGAAFDADGGGLIPISPILQLIRENADTTLVFLDACRTNPYGEEHPQGLSPEPSRGAIPVPVNEPLQTGPKQQASGVLVAYSTSPNSVALDGEHDLSPFTSSFVKALDEPGVSVQQLMSKISNSVGELTGWTQSPWFRSSLTVQLNLKGDLTFSEAISASEILAAKARGLLSRGDRRGAIIESVKAIPQLSSPILKDRFRQAVATLGAVLRSSNLRLNTTQPADKVIISPIGDRVILVKNDGTGRYNVELWNGLSGDKIAVLTTIPPDESGSLYNAPPVFSQDGLRVASLAPGGAASIWETKTGNIVRSIPGAVRLPEGDTYDGYTVSHIELNSTGQLLAVSGGARDVGVIWDVETGNMTLVLDDAFMNEKLNIAKRASAYFKKFSVLENVNPLFHMYSSVRFSKDDHYIFVSSFCNCNDFEFSLMSIQMSNLNVSSTIFFPKGLTPGGYSGFYSSKDGNALIFSGFDNTNQNTHAFLYTLDGHLLSKIPNPQFSAVGLSPSGKLAIVGIPGNWTFLDTETGTRVAAPYELPAFSIGSTGAVFDTEGMLVGVNEGDPVADVWKSLPTDGAMLVELGLDQLSPQEAVEAATQRLQLWQ